ncbi:hypothetical protein TRVL_03339 [Trypanosoma vivax]|nr:hypothetical protein TRVL_03339 [Trypanosoma vivax]
MANNGDMPSGMDRISSWQTEVPLNARSDCAEDAFEEVAPSVSGPLVARLIPVLAAGRDTTVHVIDIHRDTGTITMGRSKEIVVEHRISSARVSARHCELSVDATTLQVTIRDLSTNGTYVNGVRLERGLDVELQPGDSVTFTKPMGQSGGATELSCAPSRDDANSSREGNENTEYIFQRVMGATNFEKMEEELTCSVCKCLYVRPCTLSPCMHAFCAACISKWLANGNNKCVECRATIHEVRPTHKLQNCVDQLIRLRPNLARRPDELAECRAADEIPTLGRVLVKRSREEENSDSVSVPGDSYQSSSDESSASTSVNSAYQGASNYYRSATSTCRHCQSASALDGFRCPVGGAHHCCSRCNQLFPLRPLCVLPQTCQLCGIPDCSLYFGSEGGCPSGAGGLCIVQSYKPPSVLPRKLFGGNGVERQILSSYLASKGISVEGAWEECITRMRAGDWVPDVTCVSQELSLESALCMGCMEVLFAALLFHFRRSVSRSELPKSVTDRPNCWYGINCRTQFHNAQHANKYNHACYQEKRKE